jgi:hypothetical protein
MQVLSQKLLDGTPPHPFSGYAQGHPAGRPRRRVGDGTGLYLLLFVTGGSHGWSLDYTVQGLRRTLSLGTYPDISLGVARQKAEEALQLVIAGSDPSQARRQQKNGLIAKQCQIEPLVDAGQPAPESFEAVAREWCAKHKPSWARIRSTTGMCALVAGQRLRAIELARLAHAAFEAQPGVSPYFKRPLGGRRI